MFSETQLRDWLCKLNISDEAKDYINLVRLSEPSRRVQGGRGNVPGRYPSRKMERTIQFESHRNELSFIYNLEYDSDVLEYWDQPAAIKLRYLTENGRPHAGYYTPDFLVIRSDRIGWVECKTESELLKLSKNQHRYFFDGERWRFPPGEKVAKQNGFFFEVFSSNEINWIYLRNMKLLEDYLRSEIVIIDETHERVLSFVCAKPGISLSELLFLCQGFQIPADNIYQLIAIRSLYVDLETKLLSEPDTTPVFVSIEDSYLYNTTKPFHQFQSSEVKWNTGDSIIWDGKSYEVINCGELLTWLKGEDGNVVSINHETFLSLFEKNQVSLISHSERDNIHDSVSSNKILLQASPSALQEANRRYIILTTYSQTGEIILGSSLRTLRRWQKSFREAELIFGNGYIGLIDNKSARGNRLAKLPPQTVDISNEYIENGFETSKQSTAHSVWVKLKFECEKRGILFPSYNSFVRQINRRPVHEQDEKRRGRVAAYQYEEFYYEISPTSPKHGDRPFEIVHIDHTELDIELICSKTGKNLGRP